MSEDSKIVICIGFWLLCGVISAISLVIANFNKNHILHKMLNPYGYDKLNTTAFDVLALILTGLAGGPTGLVLMLFKWLETIKL